jgi:thiamine pyrophosphate-dependent acetolactate synthase large subunit-like protein
MKYGLPIKHILLNNLQLGKITREQRKEGKVVRSTDLHNSNFSQYAADCSAMGIRVSTPRELEDSSSMIVDHKGPAMLEVMTEPDLI